MGPIPDIGGLLKLLIPLTVVLAVGFGVSWLAYHLALAVLQHVH